MLSPYEGAFKVTQIYKGIGHKGLDLVGIDSKKLYSTVNGVVESAGWDKDPNNPTNSKYGMGLRLRIREDITGNRVYYAHCAAIYVKVGQIVKVGNLVALEGSTGHSTGSHCHYEFRKTTNNLTFLDVSKISGIPNKLGTYKMEEPPMVTKTIIVRMNDRETMLNSYLINGENHVKLRDLANAQTDDKLSVDWDAVNQKVIILSK